MRKKIVYILFILSIFSQVGYSQAPNWSVNEGLFQQTETMICKLSINGVYLESPNDMVGAFVGNQCRGVSKPVYIASAGKYLTYLTIFSNTQGDSVSFKLYNSKTGQILDAVNKIAFKINDQIGSIFQTYRISNLKLSAEAKVLSFAFANSSIDSTKVETDLSTGIKTNAYYIPITNSKNALIPIFNVSPGANVFILESPITSGVNKVDFTTDKTIQVLSEDESTLTNYIVSVRNSFTCADSIRFAPIITRDAASGYLISSYESGNIWYRDGIKLNDTSKYYKPTVAGLYKVKAPFANCMSAFSNGYYYLLTDVINIDNSQFIKVSPNPFVGNLNFEYSLKSYQKLNVQIRDLVTGALVFKQEGVFTSTKIQTSQLFAGSYVLVVYSDDGKVSYQFKLIKI